MGKIVLNPENSLVTRKTGLYIDHMSNIQRAATTGEKQELTPNELVTSSMLTGNISMYNGCMQNVNQTNSMLGVASDNLVIIDSLLVRNLDLASQATSPNSDANAMQVIKSEYEKNNNLINSYAEKEFNNIPLLDGSLGGRGGIESAYKTAPISFNQLWTANTIGAQTAGVYTITVGGGAAGEAVSYAGETFTMKGANTNEMAQNLAIEMRNRSSEVLKNMVISFNGATVMLTAITPGAIEFPFAPSTNVAGAVATAAVAGLNLNGLSQVDLNGNLQFDTVTGIQVTGVNAKPLAKDYGVVVDAAAAAAGDNVAILNIKLNGEVFTGALFVPVANGAEIKSATVVFNNLNNNKTFSINFAAGAGDKIDAGGITATCTAIETELKKVNGNFKQTKNIELKGTREAIMSNNTQVGSTEGVSATLKTKNFNGLSLSSFDIIADTTTPANSFFIAEIGGVKYKSAAVDDVAAAAAGGTITLTSSTWDEFTIYLGQTGITNLSANREVVAKAFSGLLKSGDGFECLAGLKDSDFISISVDNVRTERLYGGDATLKIDNKDDAKKILAMLTTARQKVAIVRAQVNSSKKELDQAFNQLGSVVQASKEVKSNYLDANMQEVFSDERNTRRLLNLCIYIDVNASRMYEQLFDRMTNG